MAFDAYLKLDGIKGESADARHKGEIDILAFSLAASQGGTQSHGGGGGAGKVQYQDIHFAKKADAASPLLLLNCSCGAHIPTAVLTVRKAGGNQLEYLQIKLTDVVISNFKLHGRAQQNEYADISVFGAQFEMLNTSAGTPGANKTFGDEIPMESLSLNFGRIEISYQPQSASGGASGGPVLAGWDLKANKKV